MFPQRRRPPARRHSQGSNFAFVQVGETLRRGGIVVAMSGGVDSSLCAALAVEAVGPGHVLGLGLPERESDPQSLALARDWAARLAIADRTRAYVRENF